MGVNTRWASAAVEGDPYVREAGPSGGGLTLVETIVTRNHTARSWFML